MARPPAPHLSLLALAAAAVFGCLQGEDGRDPSASADLLHRCIGEAGYDEEDFRSLLESMAANPRAYCREETGPIPMVATLRTPDSAAGSRVRIRIAVLDRDCRLLKDTDTDVDIPSGQTATAYHLWDGLDGQGRPLSSGEYFLNSEIIAADGARDTAYEKIGIIRRMPCP